MSKKTRGNIMLILTAFIWGSAFVAQKSAMDIIGPMTFMGVRTILGACLLIPVIIILDRSKAKKNPDAKKLTAEEKKAERKLLIIGGICCGILLFGATSFQQTGIIFTTAGKAGFITSLYVVIVPVMGLLLKKKVTPITWLCVASAAIGLYLLCIPSDGGFSEVNTGDLLVLICAFCFAVHILVIDYFSPKVDGVKLSCIQFFVAGTLNFIALPFVDPALGYDFATAEVLFEAAIPILYAGVLSCAVAYTFQIVAQADTDPTIASLILCLESVFAVLSGMIILGEPMSARELIGCVVMFASIVIAQLPSKADKEALKQS